MSASEKLKALKGRTHRTLTVPGTEQNVVVHQDRLWDALPQIVAVVEAAERLEGIDLPVDLKHALRNLDEALGE